MLKEICRSWYVTLAVVCHLLVYLFFFLFLYQQSEEIAEKNEYLEHSQLD